MTKIHNETVAQISKGEWIFDLLTPTVSEELSKSLSQSFANKNVSCQFYKYYLDIDLQSVNKKLLFLESSILGQRELKIIGELLVKNGKLTDFNIEEKMYINNLFESFNIFDPGLYLEISKIFRFAARITSSTFSGASNPKAFGTVFIGDNFSKLEIKFQQMSLVHELAHQELFLIQLIDRLVISEKDAHYIMSPYQGRPRPPIGRIHSLWALFRMCQFANRLGIDDSFYRKTICETKATLLQADLTQFGNVIITTVFDFLNENFE